MSNTINVITELCTEDRARLDAIIAGLQALTNKAEPDPIAEAAKRALGLTPKKSPVEPQEEAEAPTLATTPQEEETPTEETPAQPVTEKKVTQADVRALYVKLSASGKKDEAKAIILPISTTISGIPDDKVQEVFEKLTALEG
jgi:hypothetical protein